MAHRARILVVFLLLAPVLRILTVDGSASGTVGAGITMRYVAQVANPACPESLAGLPRITITGEDTLPSLYFSGGGWSKGCEYQLIDESLRSTGAVVRVVWAEEDLAADAGRASIGWCGVPIQDATTQQEALEGRYRVSGTHHVSAYLWASPEVAGAAQTLAQDLMAQAEVAALPCGASPPVQPPPAGNDGSPPVPPASGAISLCSEAVSFFSGSEDQLRRAGITDTNVSGLLVTREQVREYFQQGLERYQREQPDNPAYTSDSIGGTVGAANWLIDYGGVAGEDAFKKRWVTGQEVALRDAIIATSMQEQRKLDPGDVFYLSLKLNGGDVKSALLTAHNTLRAVTRGSQAGNLTDAPLMGVSGDPNFEDDYLMQLRGAAGPATPPGNAQDNGGPWYHLFGMGYFEMEARGDWGPYVSMTLSSLVLTAVSFFTPGVGQVSLALKAARILSLLAGVLSSAYAAGNILPSGQDTTMTARLSTTVEQFIREGISEHPPDPEKFCFNIWGAQIGSILYDALNAVSEPGTTSAATDLPPDWPPYMPDADSRFSNYAGSPYNFEWWIGDDRLVLDQSAGMVYADLFGYAPLHMIAIPQADGWSVIWSVPGDVGHQIVFQANEPGARLHLVRLDNETGQVAVHIADAEYAGEIFVIDFSQPVLAAPLVRSDGRSLDPLIIQVELEPLESFDPVADGGDEGLTRYWNSPILVGALLVVAILGVLLLVIVIATISRRSSRTGRTAS